MTQLFGRTRLLRTAAAVIGAALTTTCLAMLPAQPASAHGLGGVTDLLTVVPQIQGTGEIVSADGDYLCSTVSLPCGSLTLDPLGLLGPTKTELVPTPAEGWAFDQWTGCPTPVGDSCLIDTSLLGTLTGPLQPIAQFIPLPGLPGAAPDTEITKTPRVDASQSTDQPKATFGYAATGVPTGVSTGTSFECRLSGPGQSGGFTPCGTGTSGTKSYTGLTPGDYTFAVRAVAAGQADPDPATFTWTVTGAVPNTWLRGGPRQGGWLRAGHVAFRLGSDQDRAAYACQVDGTALACQGPRLTLHGIPAGTHTLIAAAALGDRADPTPARRTFTMPVNDRRLRHSPGWHERTGMRGYFLRSYSQTSRHGATLRQRAAHIKKIALLATKGRGFGTVQVYLGKRLLKTVSLRARMLRKRRLIPVARFRHHRHGVVRVVVVSHGRVVRIEGLGIARR